MPFGPRLGASHVGDPGAERNQLPKLGLSLILFRGGAYRTSETLLLFRGRPVLPSPVRYHRFRLTGGGGGEGWTPSGFLFISDARRRRRHLLPPRTPRSGLQLGLPLMALAREAGRSASPRRNPLHVRPGPAFPQMPGHLGTGLSGGPWRACAVVWGRPAPAWAQRREAAPSRGRSGRACVQLLAPQPGSVARAQHTSAQRPGGPWEQPYEDPVWGWPDTQCDRCSAFSGHRPRRQHSLFVTRKKWKKD